MCLPAIVWRRRREAERDETREAVVRSMTSRSDINYEKAAGDVRHRQGGKIKSADDRKVAALRYFFNSGAAVITRTNDGGGNVFASKPIY